jgi:ABC-2 type transport system ATP-binding protein
MPWAEVVEAAGLQGLERKLYGTLSGGQRQRVLFALALCGNPELLVLDEPTVGLDVEARRVLWDRVRQLGASGRAVLLTTHHLEEADALAQRVVLLARGRVVADGTPAEIKARVGGRRIRCRTALPLGEIESLPGVRAAHEVGDVTEIATGAAEDVLRALLARDATLRDLEVTGAGLEEAFVALTGDAPAAAGVAS